METSALVSFNEFVLIDVVIGAFDVMATTVSHNKPPVALSSRERHQSVVDKEGSNVIISSFLNLPFS